MSNYTFKVASVNERPVVTKFGPKKAYDLIADDGTKYGFGFTSPAKSGISVGTTISAMGEVGKFGISLDPKTVTIGGSAPLTPTPVTSMVTGSRSTGVMKPFPLPKDHGDTAIIRQNALTNAVATVADFIATQPTDKWPALDVWTDMVITTAYKYAEFSSGQREIKAAKALVDTGMSSSTVEETLNAKIHEDEAA